MERKPHIVVIPFPVQGHVKPLMQLSQRLVIDHGIKVTFVNTESIHAKITAGMSKTDIKESVIALASIPDGLQTENDRKDLDKFTAIAQKVMPVNFMKLIENINKSNDEPVTCAVVDTTIGWMMDVVKSIGLEGVAFYPMSAASLVLVSNIPKLIQSGIIDNIGRTATKEQVRVSEDIPPWNSDELPWSFPPELMVSQKTSFEFCVTFKDAFEKANWVLCNSIHQLEQSACNTIPKLLPVGPLHANLHGTKNRGNFWQEDTSSLNWLDKQKPASVIYVSLGSVAVMSQSQFNELALGLQQSRKPFLWIVRDDVIYGCPPEYPEGFFESVADNGKVVKWAPQDKVLSHPAVSCFLSHCGWNSTLEGLSAGVPFLCWPFFGDQFHNRNLICDEWKVGLKLSPDENGTVSSTEITMKIGEVLSHGYIKENAAKMKILLQKSFNKGESSSENLERFVNHLKHA